jgi:hypothetical protein
MAVVRRDERRVSILLVCYCPAMIPGLTQLRRGERLRSAEHYPRWSYVLSGPIRRIDTLKIVLILVEQQRGTKVQNQPIDENCEH